MPLAPQSLTELLDTEFDTVIDVRSPAEFAEDHVPGAINLPVLSNEERARVGTMYIQVSPFDARKLGAVLVFRNAATHIEKALSHHDGAWKPLVYCWRGGQRSGSFAWLLGEIGWRSDVIAGGYKTYRGLVVDMLHRETLPYKLVQLGGYTGTAKTELLALLAKRGVQVIDLEGLANHRGSLLGAMGNQPSQKAFESALATQLCRMDVSRPILLEAESSKIGELLIPPKLWEGMKSAPWIEVTAPLEARTDYLARAYDDILSDAVGLRQKLAPLKAHRGEALVSAWIALSESGDKRGLTRSLMQDHYDLAYAKSLKSRAPDMVARIDADGLSAQHLHDVAAKIEATLQTISI